MKRLESSQPIKNSFTLNARQKKRCIDTTTITNYRYHITVTKIINMAIINSPIV